MASSRDLHFSVSSVTAVSEDVGGSIGLEKVILTLPGLINSDPFFMILSAPITAIGSIGMPVSTASRNAPDLKGNRGASVSFLVPSGATTAEIPLFRKDTNRSILFLLDSASVLSTQMATFPTTHPKNGIFDNSFFPKARTC